MEALKDKIKAFLSISYGSGYGYGFGSGDGSGSGFGYGDGSGSGSGDGFGYGSGDGSGSGFGFGYGDGDGSGDGILNYNGHKVYMIDGVATLIYSVHSNYAKGAILNSDLTLKPCFIAKVGNSFAHAETLKKAVADATNKELENLPAEERIEMFMKEFPSPDTKASGKTLFDWHHILTGSCEMGRKQFCQAHDVSMATEYTIEYFLDITKDAYGREVIKQVRERYNLMGGGS